MCSQGKRITGIVLLMTLLCLVCFVENGMGKLYPGMDAPPFSLSNLDGKTQTLTRLSKEKKVTVIIFWSTWNKQSGEELKKMQDLYTQYQSKGLQVIAVNVEDQIISKDQVQVISDYCKDISVTFPVLIDQGLQQFNQYGIKAVPTTFLIDSTGTIIDKLAGYPIASRNQLFSTIKDLVLPTEKGTSEPVPYTKVEGKAQRYYQMAKVLRKKEDLSSAAVSLRKSIALDDDFFAAYNLLAITLYEDGKREEAAAIFNKLASKNSNDPMLQLDYGNFLIQIGDDEEEGLSIIKQVLKEDNNYARGHYYLSDYFFKKGNSQAALKEVQTAVELNPLDYDSQRLLGSIYGFQGKNELALAAYKKAATLLEHRVKGNDLILSLCY